MSRGRNWCFTLNNPDGLLDLDVVGVRYGIYQEEIGEEGVNHLQGYVELDAPQRLGWLRRNVCDQAHWAVRRGTREQARDYARKEDSRVAGPYEFGTFGGEQGKRSDLSAIKEKLDSGAKDQVIADEHFGSWVRYHKAFDAYRNLKSEKRTWKTEVILIYGPPGCGKSSWVRDMCPGAFWKQSSTKWYDDYQGDEVMVLDDFNGWLPYTDLLRLLDAYPMQLETKGGQVQMLAKWLFITCNFRPSKWYGVEVYKKHSYEALMRRIDRFMVFGVDEIWGQFDTVPREDFENMIEDYSLPKGINEVLDEVL